MTKANIKTPEEIEVLKVGGKILANVLRRVAKAVKPGASTFELDVLARKFIKEAGVTPSFENFGEPPYPAALCTSVNECLVHGIPRDQVLKAGDIIGLDCGVWYKGLCTDAAITVPVGKVVKETRQLLNVTQKSLELALAQVKPGKTLGDIGHAVQSYVEKFGYGVIRELVGHGVGYGVHEEPRIPNYGQPNTGMVLEPGMVLAIEPMVALGGWEIEVLDNEWDIVTRDRSLAAHFEHTVAVTSKGCEILTK